MFGIIRRLRRIEITQTLIARELVKQRRLHMATWEDVKAAVARNTAADAKILAKLEDLKNKPGGPTSEDMQAVIDELNAASDADETASADEAAPEAPVEAPAEEP